MTMLNAIGPSDIGIRKLKALFRALFLIVILFALAGTAAARPQTSATQQALDALQRDAFNYMWNDADPASGMAYEAEFPWEVRPLAVGGTGFGIAAIVAATHRGWVSREQALERLLKITLFLRDKTPRRELHGAFPHWLNGESGAIFPFGGNDDGADIVETSFLIQGLLIARAYFTGPGPEAELRAIITGLWEDVDWNWFTNGEESGVYWHWSQKRGFSMGLKILGYNECLITYVLAAASPTHSISRAAYDYWTSGDGYKTKTVFGYNVEAALAGAGPLFLTHYSFIGLDPRRLADDFVPGGYFVRNVKHTLSNRGYCLQEAPAGNRYDESFWGLSASQIPGGYTASEPANDNGVVAPTAALSSMPYTPHYSMQVLENLFGPLKETAWGRNGPYDGISLRENWSSRSYLAIDQLPIVCMAENYRSGLLWDLFMADSDVQAGLKKAGLKEPVLDAGFPEVVITLKKEGQEYKPDAYDLRRHPDSGLYSIPFWCAEDGPVRFTLVDNKGRDRMIVDQIARAGRNYVQFMTPVSEGDIFLFRMVAGNEEYSLPVRLH